MTPQFILPRVISGNRGDLASRWGLLLSLYQLGVQKVTVFSQFAEDVPDIPYKCLPYGHVFNLIPHRSSWQALRQRNVVLWSVGLDIQDDSSLLKLLYLAVMFRIYRRMQFKVWCLFQGAGPLTTLVGHKVTQNVLRYTDLFVARDPETYQLISQLSSNTECLLAHDAIFLPGFEYEVDRLNPRIHQQLDMLHRQPARPVIGINIRQWYHFSSSLLPYEFSQKQYLRRSLHKMKEVVQATEQLVHALRATCDARILLISAYQPGVVPWEDDLDWLRQIKACFPYDQEVVVVDHPMGLPEYFGLMSRLDVMCGMRLHSSLIAMRLGVPSVNLNYTLKGRSILQHLGLAANIVELEDFLLSPEKTHNLLIKILHNQELEKQKVKTAVNRAVQWNIELLQTAINRERI